MDEQKYLKNLVEELTHSGSKTLHSHRLQNLIKLCKTNKCYVELSYKLVTDFLKKDHAEVKYSSIQLINELFNHFTVFESLVLEHLKEFFEEAASLGRNRKIPLPLKTGQEARKLCFVVIFDWFRKYPENHLLKSAIKFLEKEYNVDFADFEIVDPKVKAERMEKERRTNLINKELLKKIENEIEDMKVEMDLTLTSLQSCFSLLLPSPDEFSESTNDPETAFEDLRLFGVLNHRGITVDIEIDEKVKIKEDDENSAILEAARDSYNLIKNRFLPKTISWVELLEKTCGDKETIKVATRQKEVLQGGLRKYEKLEIIKPNEIHEDETSDSDFEEVITKVEKVQNEEITFFRTSEAKKKEIETKKAPENEEEKTRKSELLKIAPKLPYDIDLYHWEDAELKAPKVVPLNLEGSSIWSAPADLSEMAVPGGSELLRSRVIEFSGKFEPVKRACKARLPSGKLCPRHDRYKCPLHGVIVDRDDEGNIINEEDKEKVKPKKSEVPDWQDPALLAQLKAQTGLDLEVPKKGQRLKKAKHPGLTDIKKKVETTKMRIAKKVFDKKAVKRVAQQMDRLDHKRHRDKFGDQFNYIHDTS